MEKISDEIKYYFKSLAKSFEEGMIYAKRLDKDVHNQ